MAHGFDQAWVDARRHKPQEPAKSARQRTQPAPTKPSKHRNKKVAWGGFWFDSQKECERYQTLCLWLRVGAIRDLELQPKYDVYGANGERVCGYRGDFKYWSVEHNCEILEDVKSAWTAKLPLYRLKLKLLRAQGITIHEIIA